MHYARGRKRADAPASCAGEAMYIYAFMYFSLYIYNI